MATAPANLSDRIAQRVRELRAAHGLSLEALAAHCGVSRSMISLVERGESSPAAVLLEKLATGLEVPLAALFDDPSLEPDPVARRADQPVWRDPGSGYLRRNVSPAGVSSPLQIVEVSFPAGARVAYETAARTPAIHQQVWVLQGVIDITLGSARHRLRRLRGAETVIFGSQHWKSATKQTCHTGSFPLRGFACAHARRLHFGGPAGQGAGGCSPTRVSAQCHDPRIDHQPLMTVALYAKSSASPTGRPRYARSGNLRSKVKVK